MVWTIKGRRKGDSGVRDIVVAGTAVAAAGGAAAWAAAGGAAPAVLVLHVVALTGMGAVWLQGRRTRRSADKMSSDLDTMAKRLIHLEHRLMQTAHRGADPALSSTVAEVTGEIGLLGGIIRDLAETVAAQDRDVADLKDKLERAEVRRPPPARPTPPSFEPPAVPHPEPSLLPRTRKEPAAVDPEVLRAAAILEAFDGDRLELHLQPIVSLPQRKVRFYEAFARLRLADESILVPAEFLPILERAGHSAEFDRRVIGRAIAIARHLMARGSEAILSVNLSPHSVEQAGFLRTVTRIVDAYPDTIGRLVFELSQRCWRTLDAERAGALAALRDKGVPFALDRASDLRLDPLALADRGVRFVKLPADLIIAADQNKGSDIEVADLASVLRRAGIKLVAERVEREEIVPDLIDLDIPLAQGFVFAAPRAVRSEVLGAPASGEAPPAETPDAPTPPDEPPKPPAGGDERLPFRSFLRRAG
jgi:cyclic-di-GMP phosphodiesterase, flagellum assembly factor TipF